MNTNTYVFIKLMPTDNIYIYNANAAPKIQWPHPTRKLHDLIGQKNGKKSGGNWPDGMCVRIFHRCLMEQSATER